MLGSPRWRNVGARMAALSNALRIYLTGAMCVEAGGTLLREDRFPGTQGRVVFAMLAASTTERSPTTSWPRS